MENIENVSDLLADDDFSEFEDLFSAANSILTDSVVDPESPLPRKSISAEFLHKSKLRQPTPVKTLPLHIHESPEKLAQQNLEQINLTLMEKVAKLEKIVADYETIIPYIALKRRLSIVEE
jgi:hypothetical protein